MSYRPKGKYVSSIDPESPHAMGICDYSQLVFNRRDLIKQMEWRGNRLIWTGFYVGRPFADQPNPQLKPPILPPDPIPVIDPRLPQGATVVWNNISVHWNLLNVGVWSDWASYSDGTPADPENQRLTTLQNVYFGAAA